MSQQESLDHISLFLGILKHRGNAKATTLLALVDREGVKAEEIVEAFRRHLGWEVFTRPYGRYAQAWCADGVHANDWHTTDDAAYASLRALEDSLRRLIEENSNAATA